MTDRPRQPAREAGFSLIELIIVMIIIAILSLLVIGVLRSSRVAAANDAARAAASSIDQAVADFNRIYPPLATDPLMTRGGGAGGAPWTSEATDPAQGLADETGERLLSEWPTNPYGPGGIRVHRRIDPACTLPGARPGDVLVCRIDAARRMRYAVVAWGKGPGGATVEVYREAH